MRLTVSVSAFQFLWKEEYSTDKCCFLEWPRGLSTVHRERSVSHKIRLGIWKALLHFFFMFLVLGEKENATQVIKYD